MADLYPVTIFKARYSGVYEGGPWVAFKLDPDEIGDAATADDISCAGFFADHAGTYGYGKTPGEALAMLEEVLS